jgi:hypothetical protein
VSRTQAGATVSRRGSKDGLLAIRKRRFIPQTTDSGHDFEVAVNVARRLIPTAINQLWVADITYVRLGRVDVFPAVVMDCFPVGSLAGTWRRRSQPSSRLRRLGTPLNHESRSLA